jgi:TPR repeat protein
MEATSSNSTKIVEGSFAIKQADFPDYSEDYLDYIQSIIAKLPENHAQFYNGLSSAGLRALFISKHFYFDQGLNVKELQRALFGLPVDGSIISPEAIVSLLNLFPNQVDAQQLLYRLRTQPIGTVNLVDPTASKDVINRALINHQPWAIEHYCNLNSLPDSMSTEYLLVLTNHGDRSASDRLDEIYNIDIPDVSSLDGAVLQSVIDDLIKKVTPYSYGSPLVLLGNRLAARNFLGLAQSCYFAAARLGSIDGAEYYYNELDGTKPFNEFLDEIVGLSYVGISAKKPLLFFIGMAMDRLVKEERLSNSNRYIKFIELMASYGSVEALSYLVNRNLPLDENRRHQLYLRGADSDNVLLKATSIAMLAGTNRGAGNLVKAKAFYQYALDLFKDEKSDFMLFKKHQINSLYIDMLLGSSDQDDNSKAIKYLDDQAKDGHVVAYLKLGKYFYSQGNMSSALQNFINGSLLGNAECLLLSGIIYKERRAFDYARKCIDQALNSKQLSEENKSKAERYLKEIVRLEENAALKDPEKLERDRLAQELIDEENRLAFRKQDTTRLKAKREVARQAEKARLAEEKEANRLKSEREVARQVEEARLAEEKAFSNRAEEIFRQALVIKNQDEQQALDIFLRISKLGLDSLHVKAMKEAAIILRNQKNFSEALKLFRMVEVLGDSQLSKDASYSVGCLLVNNPNSSSKNDLAYFAFKRAANLGHIKAHYAAAMLLLHQKNIAGISNPLDLSVSFLQTAASLGHVDSLLQLSLVIANATETQKARPELARIYHERYKEAMELPNVDPEKLNHEAQELIQAKRKDDANIVKALEQLDKATDLGHAESAYTAGLMRSGLYWPNFPIAYDHDKAKQSFERGMTMGHKGCKFELALMISKTDRLRSIALLEELLASGDMSVKPYLKAVEHARPA